MDWISNNSVLLAQKGLDFNWQKQRVISDNIANSETPGYKAKYLTFEEELKRNLSGALDRRNPNKAVQSAVTDTKIRIRNTKNETARADGNNVNIDVENVELARTQLQYEFLIKQINDQFNRVRTAIGGR